MYCPQLDRWFGSISDVQKEGIAHEANVRHCLNGEQRVTGKHPVTGEKLTWYDEDDFNNFLDKILSKSMYSRNIVNSSDKIITLSTCSYEYDNARTAIFAVRK